MGLWGRRPRGCVIATGERNLFRITIAFLPDDVHECVAWRFVKKCRHFLAQRLVRDLDSQIAGQMSEWRADRLCAPAGGWRE
mmetsp:Transcript_75326/g.218782  ORF Transcript_75326/g.218782 Transcript_75326/m.218782 type:complete len:82 (-) Transcript_75326:403-648(-)